jgi:hypothetical protein
MAPRARKRFEATLRPARHELMFPIA